MKSISSDSFLNSFILSYVAVFPVLVIILQGYSIITIIIVCVFLGIIPLSICKGVYISIEKNQKISLLSPLFGYIGYKRQYQYVNLIKKLIYILVPHRIATRICQYMLYAEIKSNPNLQYIGDKMLVHFNECIGIIYFFIAFYSFLCIISCVIFDNDDNFSDGFSHEYPQELKRRKSGKKTLSKNLENIMYNKYKKYYRKNIRKILGFYVMYGIMPFFALKILYISCKNITLYVLIPVYTMCFLIKITCFAIYLNNQKIENSYNLEQVQRYAGIDPDLL